MSCQNRAENIFNDALAIGETQRVRFLNDACGTDKQLRSQVEELIQAHAQLGSFMQIPAVEPQPNHETPLFDINNDTQPITTAAGTSGDQIGPYILREQLGEGGFGLVFVAEQLKPVRRKVALKIIKPGMDSQQIIARFSAELQALALMEHPNIAHVIDAGTTDKGQPYFVMELVRGVRVTEYCDENRLPVESRLRLFMDICKAIEHAHQKGIIHRDIKPANVLVATHDGRPVPKVIDFGVAKALNRTLSDNTVFTQISQVIGTPLYMSPEQSDANNLDIDTRSDIYSLGVLLYELLTGTTPLDRSRMKNATFEQFRNLIHDAELAKPSSRLIESLADISVIAANRQTDFTRLQRLIRGDLDWITARCLEKNRDRRYDSAGAVSDDIERFLNNEPVMAGPPTIGYRLKKLANKHRAALVTAALMLLMLLTGLSVATWQAIRATKAEGLADRRLIEVTHERDAKETALNLAVESANAERMAKEQSQQRLAHLEKSHEILASIFDELDPNTEGTNKKPLRVTLGERLTDLLSKLESDSQADRLLVARQQATLGQALMGLGHHDEGIAALELAYEGITGESGATNLEIFRLQNKLGDARREAGQPAEGSEMLKLAAAGLESALGPDDEEVLQAKSNLGWALYETGKESESKTLLEETLQQCIAVLGTESITTARCMSNLAYVYSIEGDTPRAAELYEEAIDVIRTLQGDDHPETLLSINNLAGVRFTLGEIDEAARLIAEALEIQKRTLGEDHSDTLLMASNLGAIYERMGRYEEAIELTEFVYQRRKARYGDDNPDTLVAKRSLGIIYRAAGDIDKALSILREVSKRMESELGAKNRHTLGAQNYLGETLIQNGQIDEGIALLLEVVENMKSELGPKHTYTLTAINNIAMGYNKSGQFELARPWVEETVVGSSAIYGEEHRNTILSKMNLVNVYLKTNRMEEAEALLSDTYPQLVSAYGVSSPRVCKNVDDVAKAYFAAEKPGIALEWLDRQIGEMRDSTDTKELSFAERLAVAGELLLEHQKPEPAEVYLRESNELYSKSDASEKNELHVSMVKAMFGTAIAERVKQQVETDSVNSRKLMDEAEKLLIAGYEGMQNDASASPELLKRIKATATKLVDIFNSDPAKIDLAAEWQQKLDAMNK